MSDYYLISSNEQYIGARGWEKKLCLTERKQALNWQIEEGTIKDESPSKCILKTGTGFFALRSDGVTFNSEGRYSKARLSVTPGNERNIFLNERPLVFDSQGVLKLGDEKDNPAIFIFESGEGSLVADNVERGLLSEKDDLNVDDEQFQNEDNLSPENDLSLESESTLDSFLANSDNSSEPFRGTNNIQPTAGQERSPVVEGTTHLENGQSNSANASSLHQAQEESQLNVEPLAANLSNFRSTISELGGKCSGMTNEVSQLRDELEGQLFELQTFANEQERLVCECRILMELCQKLQLNLPRIRALCDQKTDYLQKLEDLRNSTPELIYTLFTTETETASRLMAALMAYRSAVGQKSDNLSMMVEEIKQLMEKSKELDESCKKIQVEMEEKKTQLQIKHKGHQKLVDQLRQEQMILSLWEKENEKMAVNTGSNSLLGILENMRNELSKVDSQLALEVKKNNKNTPHVSF